MSEDIPIHVEYITAEYAEKLDGYAESYDVRRDLAEAAFRGYCEELEGSFREDAPGNVIRRIALQRLEREPPTDPSGTEAHHGIDADVDSTPSRRYTALPGRSSR